MAKAMKSSDPVETGTQITVGDNMIPDFMREIAGPTGQENIDASDVNIPRLKLGQSMTPEVKDKLAEEGDFIHNITRQVIIPAGTTAAIIPICYSKQFILWRDRKDQGGGILARANRVKTADGVRYAWDKPNTEFSIKVGGKIAVTWKTARFIEDDGLGVWGSEVPNDPTSGVAATAHYNYVIMLPEHGNQMVAISLARTAAKPAKDLNAMMKMGTAPIFGRVFRLGSTRQEKDGTSFFNYQFLPAGFVQDRALFENLKSLHADLQEKGVNVDFSDEEGSAAPRNNDADEF